MNRLTRDFEIFISYLYDKLYKDKTNKILLQSRQLSLNIIRVQFTPCLELSFVKQVEGPVPVPLEKNRNFSRSRSGVDYEVDIYNAWIQKHDFSVILVEAQSNKLYYSDLKE